MTAPPSPARSAGLGFAAAPWRWTRGEHAADLDGNGVLSFATSGAHLLLRRAV